MHPAHEPELPTSATLQVWAVPELVGMILSHLEPREIMVCKRIDRFTRDVVNGNVDVDVGRKIWTLPTGTHRKVWLVAQDHRCSIQQVPYAVEQTGKKYSAQGEKVTEPVVANPLLVETTADHKMAVSRELYVRRAQGGEPHISDLDVLVGWLWDIRPNRQRWAVAAKPRSDSTLQDPLWLQGKSTTANMQLFDPPIYGEMKATCRSSEGRIRIKVIPIPGSDTSITWGAVGKAYKRVIDQYTKRQFNTYGKAYNHSKTGTPMALDIRVPHNYVLVPQDLYWWFHRLLVPNYRFDHRRYTDNAKEETSRLGLPTETFEIADAGYRVPFHIPAGFRRHMDRVTLA